MSIGIGGGSIFLFWGGVEGVCEYYTLLGS